MMCSWAFSFLKLILSHIGFVSHESSPQLLSRCVVDEESPPSPYRGPRRALFAIHFSIVTSPNSSLHILQLPKRVVK